MKTKLICMSFDGDYKIERWTFDSIDKAWDYSNDLGSKWYFYPFHFVTTETAKTIKDAPTPLEWTIGRRVKLVQEYFRQAAAKPENQNMDVEQFAFAV